MPQIVIHVTDNDSVNRVVSKLNDLGIKGDQVKTKVGGIEGGLKALGPAGNSLSRPLQFLQQYGPAAVVAAAAIGGIAVAIKAVTEVVEFSQAALEKWNVQANTIAQVEAALMSTGSVVGFTSQELQGMASALQKVTTVSDETNLRMQSILLTFTNIRGEIYARTLPAVLDVAQRMGVDASSAAVQLGKALNDPIKNLSALSRSGIQFSEDQTKAIRVLVETGRISEAQSIILGELETQFGGSAEAARKAADGPYKALLNATGDLQERFGQGLSPEVNRLIEQLIKLAESDEAGDALYELGRAGGELISVLGPLIGEAGNLLPVLVDLAYLGADVMSAHIGLLIDNVKSSIVVLSSMAEQVRVLGVAVDISLGPIDDFVARILGLNDLDVNKVEGIIRALAPLAGIPGVIVAETGISTGSRAREIRKEREWRREMEEGNKVIGDKWRELQRLQAEYEALEDVVLRLENPIRVVTDEEKKQTEAFEKAIRVQAQATIEAKYLAEAATESEGALVRARVTIELWNAAISKGIDPLSQRGQQLIAAKAKELEYKNQLQLTINNLKAEIEAQKQLNDLLDERAGITPIPEVDVSLPENIDQLTKEIHKMERQWGISLEAMKAIEEQFARDIYSDINSVFQDLFTGQIDSWTDLWDTVVDLAVKAAAKAAAAWATEKILGGSSGGGGFNYGSLLSMFGGGGGGIGVMGGGGTTTGLTTTGTPYTMTAGGGSAGGSGALGAGMSFAAVGAILAAYGYAFGLYGQKGSQAVGGVSFGGDDLGITGTFSNREENIKVVMEKVKAAISDIQGFIENVNLEIERFGDITVTKKNKRYEIEARGAVDDAIGSLQTAGWTAEQVTDAIATLAIKTAEFGPSVSDFLEAMIQNSDAITQKQLQAEIEVARMVESFGKTGLETQIIGIGDRFDQIFDFVATQLADSIEQANFGLRQTVLGEVTEWQNTYYEITGQQRSPQELLAIKQQEARVFEAEKALRIAELQARVIQLEAEKSIGERRIELGVNILRGRARLFQAEESLARAHLQVMGATVNASASILDIQIAALNELISSLQAIPTINIGDIRLPGIGGGINDQEGRRESVRDRVEALETSALDSFSQQLLSWSKILPDLIDELNEAGLSQKEYTELLERATSAIGELGQDIVEGVIDRIDSIGEDGGLDQAITNLDDQASQLESQLQALRDAGLITQEAFDDLTDSLYNNTAAAQLAQVESQAQSILLQAYQFLGMEEESARFQFELKKAELLISIAELEAAQQRLGIEIAILGELSELAEAIAATEFVPPTIPTLNPPSLQPFNNAIDNSARELEEFQRRLDRANESIQDLINDLSIGDLGAAVSPQQALATAESRYLETLAAARGGDLEARERLPEIVRDYLRVLAEYSPELHALMSQSILAELQGLGLGSLPTSSPSTLPTSFGGGGSSPNPVGGGDLGLGSILQFPSSTPVATAATGGTSNIGGFSELAMISSQQLHTLRSMKSILIEIRDGTATSNQQTRRLLSSQSSDYLRSVTNPRG